MSQQSIFILDQAVALSFNMDTQSVQSITQIRVRVDNPLQNARYLQLNAKQLEIEKIRIHNSSIYHPVKKKFLKENMDKHFICNHQYMDPSMQVQLNNEILLSQCSHNFYNFKIQSKKLYELEDSGYLKVYWNMEKDYKVNKKIPQIYNKGYKIYFTIEIRSKINNPQGPCSFQIFDSKLSFLKDSSFGSTRNLFPCKDKISDSYYFSQIKINIEGKQFKDYQAVCSGQIQKVIKTQNSICFVYNLNKIIYPTFIGIFISQLKQNKGGDFIETVYHLNENYENQKNDQIYQKLCQFQNQLLQVNEKGSMVLLPGILPINFKEFDKNYYLNQIRPYYFYDFFIISEEFFLQTNYLEGTAFYVSQFLIYKFLMKMLNKMQFENITGFWILIGTCSFMIDKMISVYNGKSDSIFLNYEKRQLYFNMVREGYDETPLNNPFFCNPNQIYYDVGYNLKCNLVINLVANNLDLDKNQYAAMFWLLLKGFKLNRKKYFKTIKKNFNFKNLKNIVRYAIENTGSISFLMKYSYNRKNNEIDLFYNQIPMCIDYLRKDNEKRFELENYYNLKSEGNQIISFIKKETQQKFDKYSKIFLDKIHNESEKIFLSNESCKTLKKIEVVIPYILIESSQKKYQKDCNDLKIDKVEDQSVIQLRLKVRKNNNNKKNNNNNNDKRSDTGSVVNEKVSKTEIQSIIADSAMINQINIEGGEKFSFKLFFDYNQKYLFEFVTVESDEVLIAQFEKAVLKRAELFMILDLMYSLQRNNSQIILDKCYGYINLTTVQNYIKIKILDIFSQVTNKQPRIIDIVLSMIKNIQFEENDSVKLDKFEKLDELKFFLKLIQVYLLYDEELPKLQLNQELPQNDDNLVYLLLTLLQKNDNSINQKDDSFYQSFLLQNLMQTKNARYFSEINDEILRYIKIEYYNKPKNNYVISTIIQNFAKFVVQNMKILHYNLKTSKKQEFQYLEIFTEHENLKEVLELFKKLIKIYKKHHSLGRLVFRHKLYVRENIKGFKFGDLVIWGLKHLKKKRQKYGSILANNLLKEFSEFIQERKEEAYEIQKNSLKTVEIIANLLWSQMSCTLSSVDSQFRIFFVKIWQSFFSEYPPICFLKKEPKTLFPIDRYWLEVYNRIELDRYYNKEKKNVTFKYLSLQKKTKKGLIKAQSQDNKYRIRDLIYQHFKANKETITKKNIAKQIINILLVEKNTMRIEEETQKLMNEESDIKLKIDVYSMKEIKKRLLKSDIGSLDNLKQEIFCVIDSYRLNNFIDDEIYKEYYNFINLLIFEANSILKEKQDTEKKNKEDMNVKINFDGIIY